MGTSRPAVAIDSNCSFLLYTKWNTRYRFPPASLSVLVDILDDYTRFREPIFFFSRPQPWAKVTKKFYKQQQDRIFRMTCYIMYAICEVTFIHKACNPLLGALAGKFEGDSFGHPSNHPQILRLELHAMKLSLDTFRKLNFFELESPVFRLIQNIFGESKHRWDLQDLQVTTFSWLRTLVSHCLHLLLVNSIHISFSIETTFVWQNATATLNIHLK